MTVAVVAKSGKKRVYSFLVVLLSLDWFERLSLGLSNSSKIEFEIEYNRKTSSTSSHFTKTLSWNGPWWWSRGQRTRLLLQRSELK